MASWRDLQGYVRHRFEVIQDNPSWLQVVVPTHSGRVQSVYIWHRQPRRREDWVLLASPFAEINQVDVKQALTVAGQIAPAGVGLVGRQLAIRHALPLANMDPNELEDPVEIITEAADELERALRDGDYF